MSEISEILIATAERLFADHAGEAAARASRCGVLDGAAWQAVEDAGLPLALVSEQEGGFGLPTAEALNLVRIGGAHASPLPLGETMVANRLLAAAGLPLADGPATFAVVPDATIRPDGIDADALHVPWGAQARTLVIVGADRIARVEAAGAARTASPISDLPRANVALRGVVGSVAEHPSGFDADGVRAAGAILRALEMAGALRAVLDIAVGYSAERTQFGKPLAKQQAVQQQLAIAAGEVAAANAAADLAADAFGGRTMVPAAAIAKARAGEAAGIVAGIAHQVLGAIGFTEEHRLHLYTRALWAWRDEFGSDRAWQRHLGAAALAEGADGFWPFVTGPTFSGATV